jgi:hypothetical protein
MKQYVFLIVFLFFTKSLFSQDSLFYEGLNHCYREMKKFETSDSCSLKYSEKNLKSDIKVIRYFLKAKTFSLKKLKSKSRFLTSSPTVYKEKDTVWQFFDGGGLKIFEYDFMIKSFKGKIINRFISISKLNGNDFSSSLVKCFYPKIFKQISLNYRYILVLKDCNWIGIGDYFKLYSERKFLYDKYKPYPVNAK